jgi:hypothetical protein
MAGRVPDAWSVDDLWRNVATGHESLRDFSDEELRAAGADPALVADPSYVRRGTVLDGVELFDAEFFGLSPARVRPRRSTRSTGCSWRRRGTRSKMPGTRATCACGWGCSRAPA